MKFGRFIQNITMRNFFKNSYIFTFVVLAFYVITSIAFMVIVPNLFTFSHIGSSILLFLFFLILNILLALLLKIVPALKQHWSFYRLHYFFIGFISWTLVLSIAYSIKYYVVGTNLIIEESNKTTIWTGLGITLLIVIWEELMFRGVILNFLLKFSSKLYLSFVSGLLFALIHLLNPEINMFIQGLNLFFAGFLLTFLYLKLKNIWLPLGFHFANNIFYLKMELITGQKLNSSSIFFSNEGYLDTIFLVLAFFVAYRINYKKNIVRKKKIIFKSVEGRKE